jgi:Cys-rich repeat protein
MRRGRTTGIVCVLASGALVTVLAACGGADPGQGSTASGSASKSIGASGGSATTLEGASVDIPAGALGQATLITIDESAGSPTPAHATAVGSPYLLGPEGTTFPVAVTVTLPFAAASIPAGRSAGDVVIYTAPYGSTDFTALPTALADGTHARATTTHFSIFVAVVADARDDAGVSCTSDADCARGEVCTNGTCVVPEPPDASVPDADDGSAPDAVADADDGGTDADAAAQCTTDSDCPTRLVCVQGVCEVPAFDAGAPDADDGGDADAAVCQTNADCPTGEVCLNGSCVVWRGP